MTRKARIFSALAAALLVMTMAAPTLAQEAGNTARIDTSHLTEQQIADLQKQAADLRAGSEASSSKETLDNIKEYVEVGKGIGVGIGEAAKQLNVAVNDFARTPVGIVTISLIVFKVAGGKIIGVTFGLIWFAVMGLGWIVFFNRLCFPKEVVINYQEDGKTKLNKTVTPILNDDVMGMRICMFIIAGIICICGFFMMFWG